VISSINNASQFFSVHVRSPLNSGWFGGFNGISKISSIGFASSRLPGRDVVWFVESDRAARFSNSHRTDALGDEAFVVSSDATVPLCASAHREYAYW
jgi:hypothetical protein